VALGGRVALLPLWLLAALIAAGAAAGAWVLDVSASVLAGALAAAAVAWGGAFVARRVLVRLGHRAFDGLPSADSEAGGRGTSAHLASMVGWVVTFAAVRAGLGATGLATGDDGVWLAGVASFPVWNEVDARLGVRARRRRREAARRLREAGEDPAAVPSGEHTVALRRLRPVATTAAAVLGAAGAAAFAVLGDDVAPFVRIAFGACVPVLFLVARVWLRIATAPFFLRVDPRGADLLGAGPVPWPAIAAFEVTAAEGRRWIELVLADEEDEARAAPWFTRRHRPMLRAGALRAPLGAADRSAEGLIALLRSHHDAPVETSLGEGDE